MHCVYLTICRGVDLGTKYPDSNIVPHRYIGSAKTINVLEGYHGSVTSKKFAKRWNDEIKKNPHKFKTRILSHHTDDISAKEAEKLLQIKYDVVKSPVYVNMALASPNGYFGKPNKGIEFSKETRDRMAKARKGRTYEEIFGYEKAKELREARRNQQAWNKGTKTPEEHVMKAKESRKGMFFITDGISDRKVRTEDDIPEGWRRGRTNGVQHCPAGWNKGIPAWNKGMKKMKL